MDQQPVQVIPPKVFVAIPAYGQILTAQTNSSLMHLTKALFCMEIDRLRTALMSASDALSGALTSFDAETVKAQAHVAKSSAADMCVAGGYGTLSFPDIEEIRNIFLTIWYDKVQTSHMLFIDNDMGFDPQLIIDLMAFNKPLVGALCPKRKLPIEFAGRARQGNCQIVNGFMEVDGIGGAVMLIRRDVVDNMLKKWPELSDEVTVKNHAAKELMDAHGIKRLIRAFDKIVINRETFSEDLSFCFRWRECAPKEFCRDGVEGQGEVWANIMHNVTHVGPHEYNGRYFDHIKDFVQPAQQAIVPDIEAQAQFMPVQLEAAE